ncbi:MAG: D-Ala-D-Ala carboxypeptidase family metallohydrolase [Methylophilaceae bacterium]
MRFISKYISWDEAVKSKTAEKHEIENSPNENQIQEMKKLAKNIFDPLRIWARHPIRVNSFFRSPELCLKLKSKATSQHTKGQAIDIDSLGEKTNSDLFYYIKENLNFDQLIWEFGDDENPDWIHVSYVSENANRGNVLKAIKKNKKTSYIFF